MSRKRKADDQGEEYVSVHRDNIEALYRCCVLHTVCRPDLSDANFFLNCGHMVCDEALEGLHEKKMYNCPMCKCYLGNWEEEIALIPDTTKRLYSNIVKEVASTCKCGHLYIEMESHEKECGETQVWCKNVNNGCSASMYRKDIEKHLSVCKFFKCEGAQLDRAAKHLLDSTVQRNLGCRAGPKGVPFIGTEKELYEHRSKMSHACMAAEQEVVNTLSSMLFKRYNEVNGWEGGDDDVAWTENNEDTSEDEDEFPGDNDVLNDREDEDEFPGDNDVLNDLIE